MDRVAVFGDAGYLFAQCSQELYGARLARGQIALDHDAVMAKLKSFAEAASNLPLLRGFIGTTVPPKDRPLSTLRSPDRQTSRSDWAL